MPSHLRAGTPLAYLFAGLAILAGVVTLGGATLLVLNAFQSNLVFFFSPSQVAAHEAPQDRAFRIGGLVKDGSLQRTDITARFIVR